MQTEAIIDYLQFTVSEVPDWLGAIPYIGSSPLAWYQACYEFPCGTRVFSGNARSEKLLVQMAGRACEEKKMTDAHGRFSTILNQGGKFSRVDLAVTVGGNEWLTYFHAALQQGMIICKRYEEAQPKVITDAQGSPETIYLGDLKNRAKRGVFRAYNKGLELGIGIPLTRFELEIRGRKATTAIRRLVGGADIGHMIKSVVDLPDFDWWSDVMGNKQGELERYRPEDVEDLEGRRWEWLIRQVAPTLGRMIAMGQQTGNSQYAEFNKVKEAAGHKYARELFKDK